jgi:Nicotinate phosphoribosyltransferase C-terminal domain
VRRVQNTEGFALEDILYSETEFEALPEGEDLLKPVFRKGKLIMQMPDIQSVRKYCIENRKDFDEKETTNYKVSLDKKLILRKEKFIAQNRHQVQDLTPVG